MEPCSISKAAPDTASLNGCYESGEEMRHCTITNANYEKVTTVLGKIIQDDRYRICRCERCRGDIVALALNYLPPHYYVDASRGGNIGSPMVMIENAVIEAIEVVGNNPRHEKR
jgi:competence protein ComFB